MNVGIRSSLAYKSLHRARHYSKRNASIGSSPAALRAG
jgi:hypothetical protein